MACAFLFPAMQQEPVIYSLGAVSLPQITVVSTGCGLVRQLRRDSAGRCRSRTGSNAGSGYVRPGILGVCVASKPVTGQGEH